jgi:hypothetical protein
MVEGWKKQKVESKKQKWPGGKWQMADGKGECERGRCPARTAVLPGRGYSNGLMVDG